MTHMILRWTRPGKIATAKISLCTSLVLLTTVVGCAAPGAISAASSTAPSLIASASSAFSSPPVKPTPELTAPDGPDSVVRIEGGCPSDRSAIAHIASVIARAKSERAIVFIGKLHLTSEMTKTSPTGMIWTAVDYSIDQQLAGSALDSVVKVWVPGGTIGNTSGTADSALEAATARDGEMIAVMRPGDGFGLPGYSVVALPIIDGRVVFAGTTCFSSFGLAGVKDSAETFILIDDAKYVEVTQTVPTVDLNQVLTGMGTSELAPTTIVTSVSPTS